MFKDAIPGAPRPSRVTRPMDFIVWFLVLLFVCVVASRANAHWRYELIPCCSGEDCDPIPDSAIHEAGDVIIVRVLPGQHKQWGKEKTEPWVWEFKRSDLRKTLDGRWHVCIQPGTAYGLCLYPPDRGF